MKTKKSVVDRIEIECMPEDYGKAKQMLRDEAYQFVSQKPSNIFGQTIYYVTGERPHRGE